MANILTVLKVIPNDPNIDRSEIASIITENVAKKAEVEVIRTDEIDLFFGIVALRVYVKVPDSEEGGAKLNAYQESIEALEFVESVEVEGQTLTQS